MHTDRDELEKLAERRAGLAPDVRPLDGRPPGPGWCDSCRRALDPVLDRNRFRHEDCPPPPIPPELADLRARLGRAPSSPGGPS